MSRKRPIAELCTDNDDVNYVGTHVDKKQTTKTTAATLMTTTPRDTKTKHASNHTMYVIMKLFEREMYRTACTVLDAHRVGFLKRLKRLRCSVIEAIDFLSFDGDERDRTCAKYDILIADFIMAAAHHPLDSADLIERLIGLMITKSTLVAFIMDRILTTNEKQAMSWYNIIRAQSLTFSVQVLTRKVAKLESLCDYQSAKRLDLVNTAERFRTIGDCTGDVYDDFQFKWLFRIGGFNLTSLEESWLPYRTQLALNNRICKLLFSSRSNELAYASFIKSTEAGFINTTTAISATSPTIIVSNDDSTELFDMCKASTLGLPSTGDDTISEQSSPLLLTTRSSPSDRTVVHSLGLATSVCLWKRIDQNDILTMGMPNQRVNMGHLFGPTNWYDRYFLCMHQIPLDQDSQLLGQLVYLSSEYRYSQHL